MKRTLVNLAERMETIRSRPVGIFFRSLYIPLLVLAAIAVKLLELWKNRDEVVRWVLTGDTANY